MLPRWSYRDLLVVLVRVGHGAVHIGVVVGIVLGRVVRVLGGVLVAQVLLDEHTVQWKIVTKLWVFHCLAQLPYQFCPNPFRVLTGRATPFGQWKWNSDRSLSTETPMNFTKVEKVELTRAIRPSLLGHGRHHHSGGDGGGGGEALALLALLVLLQQLRRAPVRRRQAVPKRRPFGVPVGCGGNTI